MDNERLLKLAGIQITEQRSELYDAAVTAVTNYLTEVMNTGGEFEENKQPREVLQDILRQISRDVAVKYTQNT